MLILHLSDLHITSVGETLETVWNGPSGALGDRRFDFVIVSGDLSQRASEPEYRDLLDFARAHLMRLLHVKQRERVVFVPGNHDVSWDTPIGTTAPFADYIAREKVTDARRFLAELQRAPDRTGARHTIRPDGSVEVLRIDPELYQDRFRNAQSFFDRFYEHSLHGAHRKFDLVARDDAEHWSAHVFPEQGVAFYGFSSCHRNDRFWHGATLSRLAISRAAEHAREHARDLLRIAVWHHGLTGEPGRPDHLTLLDIGELYNAGFRLGFHGHTHEAAGDILDRFFGDRFVVVGTGSLGAGSEERPDAVGRQFSIVRLHPGQATVEVWERRNVGVFRAASEPRFYLLPSGAPKAPRISRAGLHRRTVAVDAGGIAEVRVELRDLIVEGRPTLAVVSPRHGTIDAAEFAETPRGVWPVIRDERPDGRVRFTLAANDTFTERLTWTYRVSNAHALHRMELRLSPRAAETDPEGVQADEECRWHEAHFPADRLEVMVGYDAGLPGLDATTVRTIVDHRRSDGGNDWWERVPDEESDRRCHVTARESHRVEFAVDAPLVGHRYTVAYRLQEHPRLRFADESLDVARVVLERTRRERSGAQGLSARLSRALDESLAEVFTDQEPSAGFSVVGFLWHPEERHLLATFGRLNHSHWGARFASGAGVAGHAFRFAKTAAWHRRNASGVSLVYKPSSEARAIYGTEFPHQWIVSVPILTPSGAAVGVVSLGSRDAETDAEFKLARFAERVAHGNADPRFESELHFAVNYAFWATISNPMTYGETQAPPEVTLPAPLREYATQAMQWLQRALGSDVPTP